jgi:CRISPR-associated exonuclease Cas4
MSDDPVNVSDLNQYLYCPRRLYYLMFYQTQGFNRYLAEGKIFHARHGRRGGWYHEVYLRSDRLGLHGKIDLIDTSHGMIPVEKKRGDRYYPNDVIQLTAYAMLLSEASGDLVNYGYIYLSGTGRREKIEIEERSRKVVEDTILAIRSLDLSYIPPFCENKRKCSGCSTISYCMPYETLILEPLKGELNGGNTGK